MSSLELKNWMAKPEVVDIVLYGRATWTPLESEYQTLRTAYHRMMLRRRLRDHRTRTYDLALQRAGHDSVKTTVRKRLLWPGALICMGDSRLGKHNMSNRERMDDLRGRDPLELWTGMENRCITTREMV